MLIIGLSVVCFALQMVFTIPFAASPFMLAFFSTGLGMIMSGTVFVLLMKKSPYRGTMLLFCLTMALPMAVMSPLFVVFMLIGGLLGELVFLKDRTRTTKKIMLAFSFFGIFHGIGTYMPVLFQKSALLQELVDKNVAQAEIDAYDKLYTLPCILLVTVIAVICACIGVYIGTKIFKKHFEHIGI